MVQKVFKGSNFTDFLQPRFEQYIRTLDNDVRNIFRWIQIERTRSIALKHEDFKKTGTDAATIGLTPTADVTLLNATGDLLSVYIHMPGDWDKQNDITIDIVWSLVIAEANTDTLSVTCDYVSVQKETTSSGIGKNSTQVTATVDATTAFGLAIGDIYTTTFTLDKDDATNGWSDGDKTIGLVFEVKMTNVTQVASIHFVGGQLNYIASY